MSSLPNLTDEFIADSYKGVLHTSNQPVTGAELRQVYDGLGNPTALKVSQNTIRIGNFTFPLSGAFGQTIIINSGGDLSLGNIFPVGSVYFTMIDINPGTFLGGSWSRVAQGRFIVGVGEGIDTNTNIQNFVVGNNNGEYLVTLSVDEMPEHEHLNGLRAQTGGGSPHIYGDSNVGITPTLPDRSVDQDSERRNSDRQGITSKSGGGEPHNNLPPSFGLYIWSRTA